MMLTSRVQTPDGDEMQRFWYSICVLIILFVMIVALCVLSIEVLKDPSFPDGVTDADRCAMYDPDQRPSIAVVFTDLQRILRRLQSLGLEPL